jgi:chromosome segregation ATPase
MLKDIWEVLTTFTDEAQMAALAKCKELGFDPNRGVVSLDESFMNLRDARALLMDAIEKKKLIQLPISIQQVLLEKLQAISRSLTGLVSGSDEVVNLTAAVEALNTSIWQFGFHNLANEVLGYQEKLNELKGLRLDVSRLRQELEDGLAQKAEVERLKLEIETSADGVKAQLAASQEQGQKVAEALARTTEADQKAAAALSSIEQRETSSAQLVATSKASAAEVAAIETRIKEFHAHIDEYRGKLTAAVDGAANTVEDNNSKTSQLVERLESLEGQIKDQIEKATGYSLFQSFQKRQESLAKSKRWWAVALAGFVLLSIGLSFFVITTTKDINHAFYLKLSLSLPLIYAITFCTVQYGRERRLEEEYAFKANISISLVPY